MDIEEPLLTEHNFVYSIDADRRIDTDKYWIIYFIILINSCIICILTILQNETAFLVKFDTFLFGKIISTKLSFYDLCLFDDMSNRVCFKIYNDCVIKFPILRFNFGNFENCGDFMAARNLYEIVYAMQAVWPMTLILAAFAAYLLQNNYLYSRIWYKVIFGAQVIIDLFVFIINIAIFVSLHRTKKSEFIVYSNDTWIIWQIFILILYAFSFFFVLFSSKQRLW